MRFSRRVMKIAALLALPVLLLCSAFCLPSQYSRVYHAALYDKVTLLQKTREQKIVIIGGSGAAFDIDSALLEEQFPDYHVVNFGLYAGLGTTVMLELALPDLHSGDIVIFMPEVSEQTLSDWFDAETMWQAAEENLSLLTRLDASRYDALLASFPRYAAQKIKFMFRGNAPAGDPVYARSSFNDHGDVMPELRPANRMPGGWDENVPIRFDSAWPTDEFITRVNSFTRSCLKQNVSVYFRFCPMNRAALAAGEEERAEAFEARVRMALECGFLGSVQSALMDPGWFFDTNFHLNDAGARMNTFLLAEELGDALGIDCPVIAARPGMPVQETMALADGDNCDADLFLYEKGTDGMTVIGLTEAGKTRDTLTVPTHCKGQPVIAVAKGAFAETDRLESLTLQGSLRTIRDGAFDGCTSLRRIILLQDDPGYCSVGTGLLEGTHAVVTVPAEQYGSYCTNYFWAVHAARLQPHEQKQDTETADQPSEPEATALPNVAHSAYKITYDGNGGLLRSDRGDRLAREVTYVHRRENTLQGTVWFIRDGYTLTAWNTASDGSGVEIPLGSRHDLRNGDTLYAQWEFWNPDSDFDWSVTESSAAVTGYHGNPDICVIPETHDGLPVRIVGNSAFVGSAFRRLVLPPSVRIVADGAFSDCTIGTLILYDSLESVSDAGFRNCDIRSLQVNAAVSPVYSGSYFDAFQDKLDYLRTLSGQRKLVLSSGSSGRYGYNSEMIADAFPALSPVNMGTYAYTNALPQLALILPWMEAGDILLYAPEFDAIGEQFCVSNRLDTGFWAMMESDYGAIADLDLRAFTGVFDSFGEYQRIRRGMPKRSYEVSPSGYDDDGQYYAFATYNQYGDFVLPRPNGDTDGLLRHNIADYTLSSFPEGTVQALNSALAPFAEKGVTVLFSYTPRNSASLTEASTPEAKQALDRYLRQTLTIPVISSLEESLMPGRYFWLIDSHLSTEGARIHTEQIIHDLQMALYTR